MSDYVKNTNYSVKDGYTTGDARKTVKGTELDTEFNDIASAIASKADTASPTFTGTPAAPTAASGTNTTQIATTAFVTGALTDSASSTETLTNKTLTSPTINGGTITGITDLTVADGGTGASSITANSVILGNGTSALSGNLVAPGTSGNLLTSDGTTWTSAAPPTTFSWNVTYSNTTVSPGSDYSIPSNTIMVFGYAYSSNNVVNNTLSSIRIKNGSTTLTDINIGFTVAANNGNGYTGYIPFSVPVSSSATTITNNIVTGSGVPLYITGYVTKA